MSKLLAEYNARLQEREILLSAKNYLDAKIDLGNLKFSPEGEIKPFFGLTCVTWVDPASELYQKLSTVQISIQTEFARAGIDHIFFFLEPASFHMTLCDITAQSTPLAKSEVEMIRGQIQDAFTERETMAPVQAQARGIGLTSVISISVRFEQESELQKVLHLENLIKQASHVNVRNFSGHITLAYCVDSLDTELNTIQKILQPYQGQNFGELVFSEFDFAYFTDMNTYIPLSTVHFQSGQIKNHPKQIA